MPNVLRIGLFAWAVMAIIFAPAAATAQPIPQAADSYQRVRLIQGELELLRQEMGRPKNERDRARVSNATLSDAYFMAVALFKKVNKLSFEILREKEELVQKRRGGIGVEHAGDVLDSALARIRKIKSFLGITEHLDVPSDAESRTITDVVCAIIDANRQLNLMLSQPTLPSDVFQQVTLASQYVSRIRAAFPGQRMPDTPEFLRRKTPSDVFRELNQCLEIILAIEQQSGINVLQLELEEEEIARVVPSDVYDLASLVVSRVRTLHSMLPGSQPARKPYYPGSKFPAHVHQRVRLLKTQLLDLQELSRTHKNWLELGVAASG